MLQTLKNICIIAFKRSQAGGEEVEILIINDGSKDNTARIADQYAAYPTIIRAIHQETKVMVEPWIRGWANATGKHQSQSIVMTGWDVRAHL